MTTKIYYFSATGNSLNFAKKLADKLNTNDLNSISEIIGNESIICEADRIGIICPVYAWGLPRIVKDFLEKLHVKHNPYIFAIASCVGIPGNTLIEINNILNKKMLELNAGFIIKAPCSSLAKKNALDKIIISLDRKKKHLQSGEERLMEIAKKINSLSSHKSETSSGLANYFGTIFHEYGMEFFKNISEEFQVSNDCTACGTCVRVCPRGNINMVDKNPVFSNNCEFCHACIQWCPEFAITHPNFYKGAKQYRNPNVKLNEMIVNL